MQRTRAGLAITLITLLAACVDPAGSETSSLIDTQHSRARCEVTRVEAGGEEVPSTVTRITIDPIKPKSTDVCFDEDHVQCPCADSRIALLEAGGSLFEERIGMSRLDNHATGWIATFEFTPNPDGSQSRSHLKGVLHIDNGATGEFDEDAPKQAVILGITYEFDNCQWTASGP